MCTASLPCEVRCLACAARSGARHASHRGLLFHYVRAFVPHASSPAATAVWRVRKSLESVLHFHPSAGNRTLPLPKSTYALHLSARLTLQYHNVQEGTLCHRIYSSHCVLCN